MTTPSQPPPSQRQPTTPATIPVAPAAAAPAVGAGALSAATITTATAAVVTILAASMTKAAMTAALILALAPLKVTRRAARAAVMLLLRGKPAAYLDLPAGPAATQAVGEASFYRAAYLVHAALRIQRRMDAGRSIFEAVAHERAFYRAHLRAQRQRLRAAQAVDRLAAAGHPWLVWRLGHTRTHTPECVAAAGHPFRADRRPRIGWPGSTHPGCECSARPGRRPRLGQMTVDQVTAPLVAAGLD